MRWDVVKAGTQYFQRPLFTRWFPPIFIFFITFAVRLYVLRHTAIINPDGPLYIFQARGIFRLPWPVLTSCGMTFLSIYPFFIYCAYQLIGNWELAARLVSLFFGTALLFPAYLLLREFFDRRASLCTVLAFGLAPVAVCRSVDVVRDPTAWFFLLSGLLLVVLAVRRERGLLLPLASVAFILATWARVEAVIYFLATILALPLLSKENRWHNLILFCGLPMAAGIVFLLWHGWNDGVSANPFRLQEIIYRGRDLFASYGRLQESVANLLPGNNSYLPQKWFLQEARRFAWLVAAAAILNRLLEAFSYGFALLFLLGLSRIRAKFPGERMLVYFSITCGLSFVLLFLFMIQSWVMEYRYTMIIIIGGLFFFGHGVERFLGWLDKWLKLSPAPVSIVAAGLIFFSVAPKIFQDRNTDQKIFAEIGRVAAAKTLNKEPVRVMTSREHIRQVTYFANLQSIVPYCPQPDAYTYDFAPINSDVELFTYLRANRINFFLWEENDWPPTAVSPQVLSTAKNFVELGRWYNTKVGQMILYELRQK